jgi:hypothetical protein
MIGQISNGVTIECIRDGSGLKPAAAGESVVASAGMIFDVLAGVTEEGVIRIVHAEQIIVRANLMVEKTVIGDRYARGHDNLLHKWK